MKSTIRDDLHSLHGQLQAISVFVLDQTRISDAMCNANDLLDTIIKKLCDDIE